MIHKVTEMVFFIVFLPLVPFFIALDMICDALKIFWLNATQSIRHLISAKTTEIRLIQQPEIPEDEKWLDVADGVTLEKPATTEIPDYQADSYIQQLTCYVLQM